MKIVVIGGSGRIGSRLVSKLQGNKQSLANGQAVFPASPATGVNIITCAGLAQALQGAEVVIDVANSPSFDHDSALEFFETGGRNLMTAEAEAGVKHHIALSMVGIDRTGLSRYFRAKMTQERLIKASGIPYTIVRSTQFFEFIASIAKECASGEPVHASPALVQPIAADDVVSLLAEIALAEPMNATIEIAGPELLPLDDVVERYLIAQRDGRRVIADIHARCFGLELYDNSLTPGDGPRIGAIRFDQWLKGITI